MSRKDKPSGRRARMQANSASPAPQGEAVASSDPAADSAEAQNGEAGRNVEAAPDSEAKPNSEAMPNSEPVPDSEAMQDSEAMPDSEPVPNERVESGGAVNEAAVPDDGPEIASPASAAEEQPAEDAAKSNVSSADPGKAVAEEEAALTAEAAAEEEAAPVAGTAAEEAAAPVAGTAAEEAAAPVAGTAAEEAAAPVAGTAAEERAAKKEKPAAREKAAAKKDTPEGRVELLVRRKRRRQQAGTAAAAVLVLAAAAGVVGGSLAANPGSAGKSVAIPAADVPAGPLTAVCPEPLRLLAGSVAGTDPQFNPVSGSAKTLLSAVVLSGAGNPVPASSLLKADGSTELKTIAEDAPDADPLAGVRSAGIMGSLPVGEVTVLSAEPSGTLQATANAVVAFSAGDGDLAGLAAANCQTPGNDMWIMGARTTVGATAVLRLTNASESAATVDLELYGAKGRVEGTGTRGILVPPGQTKSIVLAGLAANEPALAVRVRSSGGPVAAVVQQSILRGLTPGGVELIQPAAAAAPQQVITGVRIQDPAATRKLTAERGYESAAPAVQVAVPGSTNAVVSVRVLGAGGDIPLPGGGVFTVAAGSVGQLPLDALPEGTYSVEVTADVSVTANTVTSRGSKADAPVDLAVAPAGERLGSDHLAVLPPDSVSDLTFSAPSGPAEVRLTGVAADGSLGAEQIISIAAGTTVTTPAAGVGPGLAAVLINATGEAVYGSQVLTASKGDGLSVLPLPKGSVGGTSVPVGLGY